MTQETNAVPTTEMHKAQYFWSFFARRARTSVAYAIVSDAFAALEWEMKAYERYQAMVQQETPDEREYEPVISDLESAGHCWSQVARELESSQEQEVPQHMEKGALVMDCLEHRLRLHEVATHMMQLQLTIWQQPR